MQYIERVKGIEAIQNKGNIITDVIPFLNEHNIGYEYSSDSLKGRVLRVNTFTLLGHELKTVKHNEYIVINRAMGFVLVKSENYIKEYYQPYDNADNRISELESKISRLVSDVSAIKSEQLADSAMTVNKVASAKAQIKDEISTVVNLDTSKAQRQLQLLGETATNLQGEQPHVRIEFDDIRDVPKVWVDGELIGDADEKALVSLNVDWNTNTATENHKGFDINYFDMTGENEKSVGFHQGSVM